MHVIARLPRGIGFLAALPGIGVGLLQRLGIGHRRVVLQFLEAGAVGGQHSVGLSPCLIGVLLFGLGRLQRLARGVQFAAGVVESGLSGAQIAGLTPGLRGGIALVALVELADGTLQRLVLLQLSTVFLQLVQCIGNIGQQVVGDRGQGLGERVRQAGLVGLFGQLWLA